MQQVARIDTSVSKQSQAAHALLSVTYVRASRVPDHACKVAGCVKKMQQQAHRLWQ